MDILQKGQKQTQWYDVVSHFRRMGIWLCGSALFLWLLYFGTASLENGEKIRFCDYAASFFSQAWYSVILILPALAGTVILSLIFLSLRFLCFWGAGKQNIAFESPEVSRHNPFLYLSRFIGSFPTVLSSIPPFISAIFCILLLKLDTVNSPNIANFLCGILCLAAFNINYFYKRSEKKISDAYASADVLFARSLGLDEYTIFRYYVFPAILRDHITILRELLPHLTVESIMIEYTFSYNALLRAAVDDILHNSWYHLLFVVYALVLFLAFFDMLFRWMEDHFSPRI